MMSENETPKDEELNEEASVEENSESFDSAEESVEIADEENQEPAGDIAVAATDATLAEAIHLADECVVFSAGK